MRRYPALGFLAVAAALALLLPSKLNAPRTDPTTLAEFAPVPGEAQPGPGQTLGEATSGEGGFGRGCGSSSGTGFETPPPAPGPGVPSALLKRCVGDPPRQTEDPLSPPCVAFFDGDNGGSTTRGVTGQDVTAWIQFLPNAQTDPRNGEMVDCADDVTPDDTPEDLLCKAYMRYFNLRYQTYDRQVRLFANHRVPVQNASQAIQPFAAVNVTHTQAKQMQTLFAGYAAGERDTYTRNAPYVIGFKPDQDDQARMVASFLCRRLAGLPARFSGNPTDQTVTRRFGTWAEDSVYNRRYAAKVVDALEADCGITIPASSQVSTTTEAGAATKLRSEGVTSVLVFADTSNLALMLTSSTNAAWFPEWIVTGSRTSTGIDSNFSGRILDPVQWRDALGLTFDYRRGRIDEQYWYQAYKEACGDCADPPAGFEGPSVYDSLTLFFHGIQAAGPRLTAAAIDKGLHSIPQRRSENPYVPAAYFAEQNHTYVKDATTIRWDPQARAPNGVTGCYKLPDGGLRYRAGEWPAGDGDIDEADAPCQGDAS